MVLSLTSRRVTPENTAPNTRSETGFAAEKAANEGLRGAEGIRTVF
jgi:hypothetical protein